MDDQALHHFMQDLGPIVIIVAMTIGMASVLKALISAFRNRNVLRVQTDLHNKILEKFGTAEDFTAYLHSEAGKSFFDNLSKEPATPLTKILNSVQMGAILTLLGLGIFLVSGVFDTSDSRNIMFIVATVSVTTGIGFLLSSFISYRLAKSWGLIPVNSATATAAKTSES